MSIDLTEDQSKLLDLVPEGESKGNQTLINLLGWADDLDKYWSVRNSLVEEGLLALGRGRGGSIRRVVAAVSAESVITVAVETAGGVVTADVAAATVRRELDLYAPLAKVLANDWAKDKQRSPLTVDITALQGRRDTGGTWSRPDLVSAKVRTYQYVPGRHLEIITFEVKPANAIDVQAVYEALAHRRAATHAYVMLHVPSASESALEPVVEAVQTVARSHGVGVIVFGEPDDYETWNETVDAVRVEPNLDQLDNFIERQLPDSTKKRIAMELR